MKTITIKEGCSTPVNIGEKGENGVGAVLFDYSEWLNDFGEGAISLLVKRKGDTSAYPVVLATADGVATWTISDTDTAVQGYGKAEYIFTIDDKVAKSAVFSFYVAADLGPAGDPPDPYESWIDTLTALGGETLINAQVAQAAQTAAETAQTAAETAATNAATSATAAAQSAGAARFAAESALASADSASASAAAASGHATAAEAAKDLAISAAESAQHSETQAELSASAAAESAESASGSATTATTAASNASASASSASDSATAASGSASSASASATTASNAAQSATTSANNAAQSASAASQSATQAASSATNAAASATSASGSASAAATSESNAASSASGASASATAAAQSATEAAESAASASYISALPTDTASGAIASFSDGADNVPVEALSVALEPVQDLNGQDAPYPPGGGKNLLQNTMSSDSSKGITATVNSDGTVSLSGTNDGTSYSSFIVNASFQTENGVSYTLSGGISANIYVRDVTARLNETGNGATFTGDGGTHRIEIRVLSGYAITGTVVVEPMIRLSTVTDSTFAPYENLCPITGHESVGVWRTGRNLLPDLEATDTTVNGITFTFADDGTITVNGTASAGGGLNLITSRFLFKGGYIQFHNNATNANIALVFTFSDGTVWSPSLGGSVNKVADGTSHVGKTVTNVRFYFTASFAASNLAFAPMLCTTSAAMDYELPSIVSISIPLGQTVYGGTLDVVGGVCRVEWKAVDMGTLTWTRMNNKDAYYAPVPDAKGTAVSVVTDNAICSKYKAESYIAVAAATPSTDYVFAIASSTHYVYLLDSSLTGLTGAEYAAALSGVQLCYELTTPITIDLTAHELTTLLGTNNIWSDSGDVSVEYRADIQRYIAKVISEAIS